MIIFYLFIYLQLSQDIPLDKICKACVDTLEAFYKLHLVATSSQDRILEALSIKDVEFVDNPKELLNDEEVVIEFLNVDVESEDERLDEDYCRESSPESFKEIHELSCEEVALECNFCSKIYKRETHLRRHIEKHHQDGTVKKAKGLKNLAACELCGKHFTDKGQYKEHLREVTCVSKTSPECRFCKEVFNEVRQLKNHLKNNHPKGREHFCSICFKSFPTVSNRNSHLQSHNSDNTVTCSMCGQGFKSILYLRKHQKAIHTKVENVCLICDRKFDTQQKFDYHLKTHEAVKRYKCPHQGCDKSFMQHHHLENHKTTHSGVSKYLCFKCGKEFKQDCNLKAHLKIHEADGERSFDCSYPECGKTFKLSSSFRCHQKTHEKGFHSCPECGKKFAQRSSLRAHFQTHFRDPENRPFKCNHPNCTRSFYQERSIKYHKSTAHGIGEPIVKKELAPTYFCDFCQKSFQLQSLLKRHILIHIEEEKATRKHKCDKCEASFKRPEHLRLHINSVHLKFKPYKCEFPDCERSFAQIGDRNVHMKIHSDDKPHVCSICRKAFRLAKGLRAHEKVHVRRKMQESQLGDARQMEKVATEVDSHEKQGNVAVFNETSNAQIVFLLTSLP